MWQLLHAAEVPAARRWRTQALSGMRGGLGCAALRCVTLHGHGAHRYAAPLAAHLLLALSALQLRSLRGPGDGLDVLAPALRNAPELQAVCTSTASTWTSSRSTCRPWQRR